MERRQMLKSDARFGDYDVANLMSHHHEGRRNVYRAGTHGMSFRILNDSVPQDY